MWMLHEFTSFVFITFDRVPIYVSVEFLHEGGTSYVSTHETSKLPFFISKSSKLRDTGFEPMPDRMFVILAVHNAVLQTV